MPTVEVRSFATIGTVVRLMRERSGQNQTQAAESLNITRAYLLGIERGGQTLHTKRLRKILKKYRIRLSITYDLPDGRHD